MHTDLWQGVVLFWRWRTIFVCWLSDLSTRTCSSCTNHELRHVDHKISTGQRLLLPCESVLQSPCIEHKIPACLQTYNQARPLQTMEVCRRVNQRPVTHIIKLMFSVKHIRRDESERLRRVCSIKPFGRRILVQCSCVGLGTLELATETLDRNLSVPGQTVEVDLGLLAGMKQELDQSDSRGS